jgi:hypothetical protein
VVQLRGDLDLAQKPFRAQRRGDLVAQDLDGDGPVVSPVAGEEYDRHPAAAELPLNRVAVRQGPSGGAPQDRAYAAKIGPPHSLG